MRVFVGFLLFVVSHLGGVVAGAAVDAVALGRYDPKWGSPWGNVQFAVALYGVTVAVASAPFFLIALVLARRRFNESRPWVALGLCSASGLLVGLVAVSGLLKWLVLYVPPSFGGAVWLVAAVPGLIVAPLFVSALSWLSR